MIQRAFIHVAAPTGSSKTACVEALIAVDDGPILVARCLRDDSLRRSRETSPRTHPELKRYRHGGAYATARFAFPRHSPDPIEFFEKQLMLNYSRAVILEGDNPAGHADLEVFCCTGSSGGRGADVRRQVDVAASQGARAGALEEVMGLPVGDFVRKNPRLGEDVRSRMLAGIA